MCEPKDVEKTPEVRTQYTLMHILLGKEITEAKQALKVAGKQDLSIHSTHPYLNIENHRNCK